MIKINGALFQKAYKKLKSSVYFDRTQLILRDKIVEFEASIEDMDAYFDELCDKFRDDEERDNLFQEIWDSIWTDVFPKKLTAERKQDVITNSVSPEIEIAEKQYHINMCVEGHILGVLWLMLIGYRIDEKVYDHSFGNRIRKKLLNELSKEPTYSPYLFEPYFEQYESWRDFALDKASLNLDSGHDVVILTMDFRRYFYSVDMDKKAFDQLYEDAGVSDEENQGFLRALNDFVSEVIARYAECFEEEEFAGRKILPIGFLPSNVISNWCLRNFDKAVVEGWNPVYFGRYVDDILIVDKIPHNSDVFNLAKKNQVTSGQIIEFFLKQCSRWKGISALPCAESRSLSLFENDEEDGYYALNKRYNPMKDDNSKIVIQNEKLKIFYFRSGETDALITCFKERIARNKSEFRYMPEDEAIFQKDNYNEIYKLRNSAGINKFGGIESISVDKFNLSKFLGKHLRIGGMIEDRAETKFEEDVSKIFDIRTLIENYTTWEKVMETFVINERFTAVKEFTGRIIEAIEALKGDPDEIMLIRDTLCLYLHSCICRSFALVWKKKSTETIRKICKKMSPEIREYFFPYGFESDLEEERQNYCITRMLDKSVMPIPIDMLLTGEMPTDEDDMNLTKFYDVIKAADSEWENDYKLYPYLITMYDFSMITCIEQFREASPFKNLKEIYKKQENNYLSGNYDVHNKRDNSQVKRGNVSVEKIEVKSQNDGLYHIAVGDRHKKKLRVAIANVKLSHNNFEMLIKDKPNRSYERYRDLAGLVNQAVREKADMLVMPEAFVPFEWLTALARVCAGNNLAVITGIEHVKIADRVLNLTAVILPYEDWNHKSAYLSFHLKKHYAPAEQEEIRGYRLKEAAGSTYELYKWNGCYFPVYCCYELTSVYDRSLFQAYADFLVAIEWNRDVNYYSNILESLSRDIHCYCIQVNSSDYGDSRITRPSRTEEKDIIRTKGGKNSTILIDEIDIEKLREFQFKEYALQKKEKDFKITPPEFNKDIIGKKIREEDF